ENGRFQLAGLLPGLEYTVYVSDGDVEESGTLVVERRKVTISAGKTPDLGVLMKREGKENCYQPPNFFAHAPGPRHTDSIDDAVDRARPAAHLVPSCGTLGADCWLPSRSWCSSSASPSMGFNSSQPTRTTTPALRRASTRAARYPCRHGGPGPSSTCAKPTTPTSARYTFTIRSR